MNTTTHAALGILTYLLASRFLKRSVNLSTALAALLGALPDFDILSPAPYASPLGHHGLFHSWLIIVASSSPFLLMRPTLSIPYLLATLSHIAGDFVANEVPLLGPISFNQYGLNLWSLSLPSLAMIEAGISVAALLSALKVKDKCIINTHKYLIFAWIPILGFVYLDVRNIIIFGASYPIYASSAAISSSTIAFLMLHSFYFFIKQKRIHLNVHRSDDT